MKPSPPKDPVESTARTLLVVTLALEDALARQDPREIDCLVRRRQELLTRLGGAAMSPKVAAILTMAADAEKRAIASAEAAQAAIARRLRDRHRQRRAGRAYAASAGTPRWERLS